MSKYIFLQLRTIKIQNASGDGFSNSKTQSQHASGTI